MIALGITTFGTIEFYKGLFTRLDILMLPDVQHFLNVVGNRRQKRIEKTKTPAYKKKRQKDEYAKLKRFTAEATEARAKRDGVYKPGIGMTGGYDEKDLEDDASDDGNKKQKAATIRRTKSRTSSTNKKPCPACGGTDHQRRSSRLCLHHADRKKRKFNSSAEAEDTTESEEIAAIAAEMDELDGLALVVGDDEDDSVDYFSAASDFS